MANAAFAMGEIAGNDPFCPETGVFDQKPTTTQPTPMAKPLTWNAPNAKWTSGLTWNGTLASPPKMKIKASIDFTQYMATELSPIAQAIHDGMTAHAAHFPSPPITMPAFQTLITTYSAKLVARASNASADVLAFNLARHDREVALHDLGSYVNLVAKGDPTLVEESGFPSYGSATPAPSGPPPAPTNLRLRAGDLPGTAQARCKPGRPNSFNVAQICTGDPNVEANWHTAMQFSGGKVIIGGLTVGGTVWVRIATVGTGGQLGPWCDPAKIVVT